MLQPCVATTTVVGDGIDNDCDGLIDEELCTPENQAAGKIYIRDTELKSGRPFLRIFPEINVT